MAVFRCKMCGGELDVQVGASVCTCEYCGAKQTLPVVDDDAIRSLFNRANVLRMKAEFDKAADVYEKILQQKEDEAEAYWGLILCKYGIEYVEDPKIGKRIPTCHRASYDPVVTDEDYKNALRYADPFQRSIYEEEAAAIDEIQKGILAIAQKNEPYDVFICYKETDEDGRRTTDSVLANDIYHQLTQEGFKVFFAAISLEDKLGTEYESHIFSALNTAKVMLVLGTKPEFFNAVWVKNEWSRFLQIMKKDRNKLLIPCYKGMDPYELPEEFSHLQAQDMGKIGFINDLIRGIKKLLGSNKNKDRSDSASVTASQEVMNTTASVQLRRGDIALEDEDWGKADQFFEETLNLDPECAEAYLGKFLAQIKKSSWQEFIQEQKDKYQEADTEVLDACPKAKGKIDEIVRNNVIEDFLDEGAIQKEYEFDRHYVSSLRFRKEQKEKQSAELKSERLLTRAQQYAKGDTKAAIEDGLNSIYQVLNERIKTAEECDKGKIEEVTSSYHEFLEKAEQKVKEKHQQALDQQEQIYQNAVAAINEAKDYFAFKTIIHQFEKIRKYKDSLTRISECEKAIALLESESKQEREEREKKKKKKAVIIGGILLAIIVVFIAIIVRITPWINYKSAEKLSSSGKYEKAIEAYTKLNGYKDSDEQIKNCKYNSAIKLLETGEYNEAITVFSELNGYKDSLEYIEKCNFLIKDKEYDRALTLIGSGKYVEAYESLAALEGYRDSAEKAESIINQYIREKIRTANVGDIVLFGTYEQDDDFSNGKEHIEWKVLEKKDDYVLLISQYALDSQPYNKTNEKATWESCTLRGWLNKEFLEETFCSEEREMLKKSIVTADSNPQLPMDVGNDTRDYVFLLSIPEAEKYFLSDFERMCIATKYAERKGVATSSTIKTCRWWLRTPTKVTQFFTSIVTSGGVVDYSGNGVGGTYIGIRPVIRVEAHQ